MTESEIQKRRDRRINILYKNLEHASNAYFAVESVFPFWEAAFALIVGQLIVAYFNPDISIYQQQLLAFIGLVISLIWFILVSLNFQNASHMEGKIINLHQCLNDEINSNPFRRPLLIPHFINPWPIGDDKKKWTLRKIFLGLRVDEKKFDRKKALKSTWFYRKVLPFILSVIWISLLAWQIGGWFGVVVISILIIQLVSLIMR